MYGMKNQLEFIAESMSNPDFIYELSKYNSIDSNDAKLKKLNIFEEFIEIIEKLIFNKSGNNYIKNNLSKSIRIVIANNISSNDNNMYQLQNPQEQWTELPFTAKGIYKYDYQRTIDAGEKAYSGYVNQFGSDNVTFIPITDGTYKSKIAIKKPLGSGDISEDIISKEDSAIENMKELAKAPVRLNAEQMSINFDTYFPGETWLEDSEKEAIMRTIENGENEISCNFI